MTVIDRTITAGPAGDAAITRLSARFGIAFAAGHLGVMILMAVFVLPNSAPRATPLSSAATTSSEPRRPTD